MNKVTPQMIDDEIDSTSFHRFVGTTMTVCLLKLHNGIIVLGQSACVDPANFDEKIGQDLAEKDAKSKMWALLGFRLADEIYNKDHGPDLPGEEA